MQILNFKVRVVIIVLADAWAVLAMPLLFVIIVIPFVLLMAEAERRWNSIEGS